MERMAVVAPGEKLRDALVAVADAGLVELDEPATNEGVQSGEAAQRLQRLSLHNAPARGAGSAVLTAAAPDLDALERAGRADLLAGEAQLEKYVAGAVQRREVAAVAGWCPTDELPDLSARLDEAGAARWCRMPTPRSMDPPTLLGTGRGLPAASSAAGAHLRHRAVSRHRPDDVGRARLCGDVRDDVRRRRPRHCCCVVGAVLIRLGWIRRFPSLRPMWMFVAAAGIAAAMFGASCTENSSDRPGVVPVLWLAPLDDPLRLLLVALAVGAVLLGLAYTVGAVNRWREGGYSTGAVRAVRHRGRRRLRRCRRVCWPDYIIGPTVLVTIGAVVALAGLALALSGLYAESGGGASADCCRPRSADSILLCDSGPTWCRSPVWPRSA